MNQRKMQQMMQRMGINSQEIDAIEVIINTPEKQIIITNPHVSKINMMGQESFQVVGNVEEKQREKNLEINEEDIKTVMEQANVGYKAAKEAITKNNGDLAASIIELSKH